MNPRSSEEWAEAHWLNLKYSGNPLIRLNVAIVDRIFADDDRLVLQIDQFTATLAILGGRRIALELAGTLSSQTRAAPITARYQYQEARRRLEAMTNPDMPSVRPALVYGDNVVSVQNRIVYVGDFCCRIEDVARYGDVGAAVALDDGHIQAVLLLLVFMDSIRSEDEADLRRRIEDYEAIEGFSR